MHPGLSLQLNLVNYLEHGPVNYTMHHLICKYNLQIMPEQQLPRQPRSPLWQQADLYIAVPDRIAVVLQDNMSLLFIAKTGNAAVLAGGKQRIHK